jgi:hypothetical protein
MVPVGVKAACYGVRYISTRAVVTANFVRAIAVGPADQNTISTGAKIPLEYNRHPVGSASCRVTHSVPLDPGGKRNPRTAAMIGNAARKFDIRLSVRAAG